MAAIAQRDYEAMLTCIARLYDCEHVEQFAQVALEEIPKLIGSDHSTFNYVAPSVPKVNVRAFPEVPNHGERQRVFARYVSQHPVLNHYLATGDGGAFKISDFQSEREYHALDLYQNFYRELRYEDQIAIELFPPASELISLAFARDRRSFIERDRNILNLLRPHLARAYRHVERVAWLKRSLDPRRQAESPARVTSVLLDAEDRPVQFGAQAQQWINHFFPDRSHNGSRLPRIISDWLRRIRPAGPARAISSHKRILNKPREAQCLRLRVIDDPASGARMLVLGLETLPDAARSALGSRLTRREIEVVLQVEQGKTNEETAAALGISPLTVRTHLEHIFEKLRVPSRTAAVTHFRRLCERVTLGTGGIIATLDAWLSAVSVVTA